MKNLGAWLLVEAGASEEAALGFPGWTSRVVPGFWEDPPGVLLGSHCQDFSSFSAPALCPDPGAVGGVKCEAVDFTAGVVDAWRVEGEPVCDRRLCEGADESGDETVGGRRWKVGPCV